MKKKLFIAGGVIVGIIVVFVILCFTLFSLQMVEIDWRTSLSVLAGKDSEIIESGDFSYGGSVFFMGKKSATKKIEEAFPYIKVVNIETVFPSKFVIHCAERQEVYAVEYENKWLILDEEFKVLNITTELGEDRPIPLSGIGIKNTSVKAGDFLVCENRVDIYSAFLENYRFLHEQKALIKSIEIGMIEDVIEYEGEIIDRSEELGIIFKMNDGQTYVIKNCTYALRYKIAKMLAIYSSIYDELLGQQIEGEARVWTKELISQATIEINNYYRTDLHSESETVFKIIPPQNV